MGNMDVDSGLFPGQCCRYIEVCAGTYAELIAITDDILKQSNHSLSTIGHQHRLLHEQGVYSISTKAPHGSELANDAELNIVITAVQLAAHISVQARIGGDAELYVYEEPADITGGDTVTPVNRHLGNGNANATALRDVTVNDPGTERGYLFCPGGQGPLASGAEGSGICEWILPAGMTLMFRLFNRSGLPAMAGLCIAFSEE